MKELSMEGLFCLVAMTVRYLNRSSKMSRTSRKAGPNASVFVSRVRSGFRGRFLGLQSRQREDVPAESVRVLSYLGTGDLVRERQ